jgi:hypothetical protein
VQAAVSAIYVAVVAAPAGQFIPARFLDALVGGVVALLVNQLPLDPDPLGPLVKDARPLVDEMVAVLDETARALEANDGKAAERALEHARQTDPSVMAFHAAVAEGLETARLDPLRRRRLGSLAAYEQAAQEADFAMRNVRVVARAATVLMRLGHRVPAPVVQALDLLATAVRSLGDYLEAVGSRTEMLGRLRAPVPDDAGAETAAIAVRENALAAVRVAGTALSEGQVWPVVMIVGATRGMAVDLLLGVGVDRAEVLRATDEALGIPAGAED